MLLRLDTKWLVIELAVDPAYRKTALYLQGCACDWQLIGQDASETNQCLLKDCAGLWEVQGKNKTCQDLVHL